MSEKTGLSQILEHRRHSPLVGAVARHGAPLDAYRAVAVLLPFLSEAMSRRRDRAGTRGVAIARIVVPLVCLVVGGGQPGGVLLVGGRQAELLPPVSARHGLADRLDVGSTWHVRPAAEAGRRWRLAGSCRPNGS